MELFFRSKLDLVLLVQWRNRCKQNINYYIGTV